MGYPTKDYMSDSRLIESGKNTCNMARKSHNCLINILQLILIPKGDVIVKKGLSKDVFITGSPLKTGVYQEEAFV